MSQRGSAWVWVPLANIGEGLPYAIVNIVLVAMLADLQFDASMTVLIASLCALPWSLKALWSPVVEAYGTRKQWMRYTQYGIGLLLLILALTLDGGLLAIGGLALLIAILAATYDIACDGHYMRVLSAKDQAYFVGIRTTAYRIGMLLATGGMTALCGWIVKHEGLSLRFGWQSALLVAFFIIMATCRFILPTWLPQDEAEATRTLSSNYGSAFRTFFHSKSGRQLTFMFAFLFFYRLGEALLSKVTILFLKDTTGNGGLALNNEQYGLLYGTIGVIALIGGGILGGMTIARYDLKRCLIPMALMLNVPDLLYVWLAATQQGSLWAIGSSVGIEQFGYGFGLAAYTVYLLRCANGQHQTSHYAFLTAIMGISLALPTMVSGFLIKEVGYTEFFWIACLSTLPGMALASYYAIKGPQENETNKKL